MNAQLTIIFINRSPSRITSILKGTTILFKFIREDLLFFKKNELNCEFQVERKRCNIQQDATKERKEVCNIPAHTLLYPVYNVL